MLWWVKFDIKAGQKKRQISLAIGSVEPGRSSLYFRKAPKCFMYFTLVDDENFEFSDGEMRDIAWLDLPWEG